MGFSLDDREVRVDFFDSTGKWYETLAVTWVGPYDTRCFERDFMLSLEEHFKKEGNPERLHDMDAVCLKPYGFNPPPLMIKNGRWVD